MFYWSDRNINQILNLYRHIIAIISCNFSITLVTVISIKNPLTVVVHLWIRKRCDKCRWTCESNADKLTSSSEFCCRSRILNIFLFVFYLFNFFPLFCIIFFRFRSSLHLLSCWRNEMCCFMAMLLILSTFSNQHRQCHHAGWKKSLKF